MPDSSESYREWVRAANHRASDTDAVLHEESTRPDWAVLDHYGLGEDWLTEHRAHAAKQLVIDDLADRPLPSDVVVNPNPWATSAAYADRSQGARLLLGLAFAPIRSAFTEAVQPRDFGPVERVLISLGGGAPPDILPALVEATRRAVPDAAVDVVLGHSQGSSVPSDPKVTALSGIEARQMAALMANADLAIGGAGTSSWERCLLGLPSAVIRMAPNQGNVADALARSGSAIDLGDSESVRTDLVEDLVARLDGDTELRRLMSRRASELVDGRGARRLANVLEGVRVRPAEKFDSRQLWEWANDPATRKNSLSKGAIPWSVHTDWFEAKLANTRSILLIGELASRPIGQIRFDLLDPVEVSISIAPERRGEFLGELLLEAGLRHADAVLRGRAIIARVRQENSASRRLFEAAGFAHDSTNLGILTLRREEIEP